MVQRNVVVLGSGVAGLTAAVAAAEAGATVQLFEKSPLLGGTTALSGGVAWMPVNHLMPIAGVEDTKREALDYLLEIAEGDLDRDLLDVMVNEALETAKWVEEITPLNWQSVPYPDYHSEKKGAKLGHRSLEPQGWSPSSEIIGLLRSAPNVVAPISYRELIEGIPDRKELEDRKKQGMVTMGRALLASLVSAAFKFGVQIETDRSYSSLSELPKSVSVILATGGFERNADLCEKYLGGSMIAPTGAPGLKGDAVSIGQEARADFWNMTEAWWCPAIEIPGEKIGGEPFYRLLLTERARPGSLIVDCTGKRFLNESSNYNDAGRTVSKLANGENQETSAWMVFDTKYRSKYHLGPLRREDSDPSWLSVGSSIAELGSILDIPVEQFESTVERFNSFAASGSDPDFKRGESAYDLFVGDLGAQHPNLRPLTDPPFYALAVKPGCLGTKGGPRIDSEGRVIREGKAIPRLYAAGNAAGSPLGTAYPGAGGTIGPHLVFSRRAGLAAANDIL